MKFHPDVLWPQCKDTVKWVGKLFYKNSLSFVFREKFRFERCANIILMTSQCIMYFKTTWFLVWKNVEQNYKR